VRTDRLCVDVGDNSAGLEHDEITLRIANDLTAAGQETRGRPTKWRFTDVCFGWWKADIPQVYH